jgi:hypothetical protein
MGSTALMGLPFPEEDEDPFLPTMNNAGGFFPTLDVWLQAIRENADLRIIEDGSPWTIDPATNTVAWGTDIVLYSGTDGGSVTISAASIVAGSPSVLYVTLARRPVTGPLTTAMKTGASLGALAPADLLVAMRINDQIALRNLVATRVPNLFTCGGNPNGNITATKIGDVCVDAVNGLTYRAYAADDSHWQL